MAPDKDEPKPPNPAKLIFDLQRDKDSRRKVVEQRILEPRLAMLRNWQAARLERTYSDLMADERYGPAGGFFLSDIYAARDFSQRDQDLEHLHALLSRFIPEPMLRLLADSIRLNQLSADLDQRLLRVLVDDLGVTDSISSEQYAEGYRRCDNYAERSTQIELLISVIREVSEGSQLPLVNTTLRLARLPAQRAGWLELHDFLLRGYLAFKKLGGSKLFADTIERRESRILDQIYSRAEDPFNIS